MCSESAEIRRGKFIADLVEVCKKHRVMIDPDGSEWEFLNPTDIMFEEVNDGDQFNFSVGLDDLEEAVRCEVWPIVHPVPDGEFADGPMGIPYDQFGIDPRD